MILVPAQEVWDILDQINNELGLKLHFGKVPNDESGFLIDFEDDGQPAPRFLGISSSKDDYNHLEQSIPSVDSKIEAAIYLAAEGQLEPSEAYRLKMESAVLGTKNKSKASKNQKSQKSKKSKNGKVTPTCAANVLLLTLYKTGAGNYVELRDTLGSAPRTPQRGKELFKRPLHMMKNSKS